MTQTYLRFFGQPRLERDGEPVVMKSRKGLALLAYLSVVEGPAGRDFLATLLWPEYDQTRARANLRRTLYNLNQTPVTQWLFTEQGTVTLRPDESALIDVRRFSLLVHEATPDALAEAVALYQADFLAGLYLPDSEPFDQWITIQQQKYRRQALETLAQLVSQRLDKEAFSDAEGYARRQLEIDDLREPAWRQLMTVLVQNGRQSEALTEYEKCRQLLWDELGVEPAAETTALAEEIRSHSPEMITTRYEEVEKPPVSTPPPISHSPDYALVASPYRGLFAFREEDAPFFFGREEFTELLASAVGDQSIVAVIGPSGSGKSSVVYAGLLAHLRQTTNWVMASFRPGQRPFQALAATLVPYLDDSLGETERLEETHRLAAALEQDTVTLYDVVERIRQKHHIERLLLVADQFEELYTLVPDTIQRHRFLDRLLELVFMQQYRPAPVFTLVLTLRADFLGQALAHRPTADAIQEVDVKLGPMTGAELKRAVAHPAQRLGATFEAGLVPRILDDVGDEPGNLPLLEFALTNLWEQGATGHLTHSAYEAIGRVEGALARYADEGYAALKSDEQTQARRIFIQLVRPGEGTEDTRRLATRAELGDDWQLVPRLADARLVITGRDPAGVETVEIVHEALIQKWGRLGDWMAIDREFRVWQERLRAAVRDWQMHDQDDSGLLRGVALSTAENWLAERPDDLSHGEEAFITAGIDLRERRETEKVRRQAERERLRRRFTWTLGAGLLLSLILAAAALIQWQSASRDRDAARLALARQLAAQSETMLSEALDLSLLLAVEAVRWGNTAEMEQTLNEVLAYSPNISRFLHLQEADEFDYRRAGLRSDGRLALGDGEWITLWDARTGERIPHQEILDISQSESDIVFSPDGRLLAIFNYGPIRTAGVVWIYDARDGQLRQSIPTPFSIRTLLFSPDSRLLATISQFLVRLWDIESGQQVGELGGGEMATMSFSPDGRLVAAGGAGGGSEDELFVWDVSSGVIKERLPAHEDDIIITAFSPDGRFLASGSADGTIRLWDTGTWSPLSEPMSAHDGDFLLAFAPDGLTLASAGADGLVRRWLTAAAEPLGQPLLGHQEGSVFGLSFAPDGQTLLTGMMVETANGPSPQIIAWQLDQPPISLIGHDDDVLAVAFGPQEGMITSFAADGEIRRWSTDGHYLDSPGTIDFDGVWWSSGLSPNSQFITIGTVEGPVVVYDGSTGKQLMTLDEPALPIAGMAFTADGQLMAGGGCGEGIVSPPRCDSGRSWVWDIGSGDVVAKTEFVDADMVHNDVTISPDGRLAAAGTFLIDGDESRMVLWDVASGELLTEHAARAEASSGRFGLAFSPDGQLLTANGPDGFTMWEIQDDGQLSERFVWEGIPNVTAAVFTPDGGRLATGEANGVVALWDVASGDLLVREDTVHNMDVTALRFSENGQHLVSSSLDNTVVLFNVEQLLDPLDGEEVDALEKACLKANRHLTQAEWQRYFGDEPYSQSCAEILNTNGESG